MHAWHIIAFLLAVCSTVVAAVNQTRWALSLLAASFACWLLPAALQLH